MYNRDRSYIVGIETTMKLTIEVTIKMTTEMIT